MVFLVQITSAGTTMLPMLPSLIMCLAFSTTASAPGCNTGENLINPINQPPEKIVTVKQNTASHLQKSTESADIVYISEQTFSI
jgi:hypothetical protein